jgi:hypothetical protein
VGETTWLARVCHGLMLRLVYSMRLILGLLLLLQLDPIIGAALCLEREHAASEECFMPERSSPAERSLAPAGAQVEGGCSVAQFCAQPAPVIAQTDLVFQFEPIVHRAAGRLDSVIPPHGSLAPPFHPPRV